MVNDYISMVKLNRTSLYHLAAWTIFATYEVSTIYFVMGRLAPLTDYFCHYLLNMALFYTNVGLLTGRYKNFKRITLVIMEIACYMILNYGLNSLLETMFQHIQRPTAILHSFALSSLYRCLYFLGLSTFYSVAVNLIRSKENLILLEKKRWEQERKEGEMASELLSTQNALLRSQINPHLFFNTLNFIYTEIYKVSSRAGEAVMLLSEITRYSIRQADANGLSYLSEEIASVRDLLQLNQLRFNGRLELHFKCEVEPGEMKIIPLAFLTLVENVLKFGDLQDPAYPAVITLEISDDKMNFATRNKKMHGRSVVSGTGIGLANTRMRLKQVYQDNFTLRIHDTDDLYYTQLTIPVEQLCLLAIS